MDAQQFDPRDGEQASVESNPTAPEPVASGPDPAQRSAGEEPSRFEVGQRVWGPILRLTEDQAVVALGEHGLAEGTLDLVHLRDEYGNLNVSEGDEVQAYVTELGAQIRLAPSLDPPAAEVYEKIRAAQEKDETVRGRVIAHNRGGLEVQIEGRRAFCPFSQIELGRCEDPEIYINRILDFKVAELDEAERRIVLSRRAILEAERTAKLSELRTQIKEGAEFEGIVRRLQPFGAFVDIGGIDGLVHVSEISHDRIEHPRDALRRGEKVRVKVLGVFRGDDGKERIKLSIKATLENPWDKVTEIMHEGDIVTGTVVRITDFGAFVKLYPGIEGLLHVSQYKPRGATTPAPGERPEPSTAPAAPAAPADTPATPTAPAAPTDPPATPTAPAAPTDPPATAAALAAQADTPATPTAPAAPADPPATPATPAAPAVPSSPEGAPPVSPPADNTPKVGQEIFVRLSRIDAQRRRISLALRDEDRPEGSRLEQDAVVGEVVEGVVRTIKPYGVFLDLPSLGPWVSGLLPGAETGLEREVNLARKYRAGERVKVVILEIDDRGRIRLSQRSLQEGSGGDWSSQQKGRGLPTAAPGGFNAIAEAFKRAQASKEKPEA